MTTLDWSSGSMVVRASRPEDVQPDHPIAVQARRESMTLTRPQTLIMLVEQGFISEAEALAAGFALPAAVEAAILGLPAPQQTEIRIRWVSFEVVPRSDPFIALFATIPVPPLTDEQLDGLFEAYALR